ncbi:hypothetical protein HOP50_04g32670 [Chloropicon primus]|uniref:Secreted protein n=1 Tax=Chloropicon primus TaxID=1764295 RepID=A0A5B8MM68_9CHLO|nr:hypothetical protein A3770_04p32630 [Chloropicon primus]UPQ99957.1 hypothetical protein HOP50_04g32670 [Chloropicon primus]|mmetsp:Transcript_8684/g.24815  ORF Transcript_8684/g.24815 Transcript_8684/m.24815 type:complete len:195 (+) Transcript_8684:1051-1635(+)|eukprot:QDZ20745.1 hypothetical protein A3770_04p32630 [Chloropicon primus]
MNKYLVGVLAALVAVQSVAAVRTEPKVRPEHSALALNQKLEASWKWEVTFDIFEGLIQGFFEYEKYPNLKQCASDITQVYDDLDMAVKDIKEESVRGVKEGIRLIGESLTEVSTAITDCQGAINDVESILHVLSEFKTPAAFAYHVGKDLLINGVDILNEIQTAVSDWESQSYRDCGVQVGTALNQLLIGQEAK